MKSVAAEERRIQQQIVAQQKKELTTFLENQKKEYRLCKDKIKEVNITNKYSTMINSLRSDTLYLFNTKHVFYEIILTPFTLFCCFCVFYFVGLL